MTSKRNLIALVLGLAAATAVAGAASADTRWENRHPRQDQVLDRDAHLRREIRHERREGELTRAQAHRMMRADHVIAREDHLMARANGGYITKGEQRALNHQETRLKHHVPG